MQDARHLAAGMLTVHEPALFFLATGGVEVVDQFAVVGVARERVEPIDFSSDCLFFTEDQPVLVRSGGTNNYHMDSV